MPLSRMLLDGHELHLLLEEAVHQLNNLPYTPAQARELTDQDEVALLGPAPTTCPHPAALLRGVMAAPRRRSAP